jgi:hypothetical protein
LIPYSALLPWPSTSLATFLTLVYLCLDILAPLLGQEVVEEQQVALRPAYLEMGLAPSPTNHVSDMRLMVPLEAPAASLGWHPEMCLLQR